MLKEFRGGFRAYDLEKDFVALLWLWKRSNKFRLQESYAPFYQIGLQREDQDPTVLPYYTVRRSQRSEFPSLFNPPRLTVRGGTSQLTYYTTSYTYVQIDVPVLDEADLDEMTNNGTLRGVGPEGFWAEADYVLKIETQHIKVGDDDIEGIRKLLDANNPPIASTVISMEQVKELPTDEFLDAGLLFFNQSLDRTLLEQGLGRAVDIIPLPEVRAVVVSKVKGTIIPFDPETPSPFERRQNFNGTVRPSNNRPVEDIFANPFPTVTDARINLSLGLRVEEDIAADGVDLEVGDLIFLLGQEDPIQNGLYYVQTERQRSIGLPWTLLRIEELPPGFVLDSVYSFKVTDGEIYRDSFWLLRAKGKTVGIDVLPFTQVLTPDQLKQRNSTLSVANTMSQRSRNEDVLATNVEIEVSENIMSSTASLLDIQPLNPAASAPSPDKYDNPGGPASVVEQLAQDTENVLTTIETNLNEKLAAAETNLNNRITNVETTLSTKLAAVELATANLQQTTTALGNSVRVLEQQVAEILRLLQNRPPV